MSLPDSASEAPRGVLVRRPQSNVFTALLGIALLALVLSSLLLVLEWASYGFEYMPPPELRAAAASPAPHLPLV